MLRDTERGELRVSVVNLSRERERERWMEMAGNEMVDDRCLMLDGPLLDQLITTEPR